MPSRWRAIESCTIESYTANRAPMSGSMAAISCRTAIGNNTFRESTYNPDPTHSPTAAPRPSASAPQPQQATNSTSTAGTIM